MLLLMGGAGVVTALADMFGLPGLSRQMRHADWYGLHVWDLVFPTFLFLAGVSFPFSCAKSRENGKSDASIALRILVRCVWLVVFGLVAQGGLLRLHWQTDLRVWSVLGRIGIAWACAAWLYLVCGIRTRIVISAMVLAGVYAATLFLVAPDVEALIESGKHEAIVAQLGCGPFSPVGNFGCWMDRTLTAGHIYKPLFDPEGFAGVLPAVVTALLGIFAGEIVRKGGSSATAGKACRLCACGVACLAVGYAISPVCPLVKALWSPSYVLVAGGYAFILFSLFYWLIDARGCRRGTFFFKVVGMNSLTIYLLQHFVDFSRIRDFLFGGIVSHCPVGVAPLVSALGYVACCWLLLFFLYRKQVFLRV